MLPEDFAEQGIHHDVNGNLGGVHFQSVVLRDLGWFVENEGVLLVRIVEGVPGSRATDAQAASVGGGLVVGNRDLKRLVQEATDQHFLEKNGSIIV